MITFDMRTTEFNQALRELDSISRAGSTQIVKKTAGFLLKTLVILTGSMRPGSRSIRSLKKRAMAADTESGSDFWLRRMEWKLKYADRARAGWWAAWSKLGLAGTPKIRNAKVRSLVGNEGAIVDRSKDSGLPYIIMANEAPHIEALNDKKNILGKAMKRQTRMMQRTLDKIYTSMLKRKSG